MNNTQKAVQAMYDAFCQYLVDRAVEEGILIPLDDEDGDEHDEIAQNIEEEEIDESKIETDESDDFGFDDQYDENGRPLYLLCDEIWDILAEAGHGCEIIIHGNKLETLYYDDFATQDENVRFMSHISGEMDKGYLVTVNGHNILDLY